MTDNLLSPANHRSLSSICCLLLDDVFTNVEDLDLAVSNDHPNIELRIFDPIARKGIYAFNYLACLGFLETLKASSGAGR